MTGATRGASPTPTTLWLAAILLVAANLRPVVTSLPPVIEQLVATFGLSGLAAGLLTTLPVVCMGMFAPVASIAARRIGEAAILSVAVALIAAGAAARSVGGLIGLYAATAVAGVGIAVAGTLLPTLVRSAMPDRVAPVTGLYTAALIGGAFVAAASTEPVRATLGLSAQAVLAVWAAPAVIALVLWLARGADRAGRRPADDPVPAGAVVGLPWRSRAAWLGTLFMGTQSLLFYATLAWLPAAYGDLGMSPRDAGLLLGLFSAAQIITAFAMPALAHRTGGVRPWIAVSVGVTTSGLFLVAVSPMAEPWAWAALLGLGMGGNLALALTVLTQIAPTPWAASAYTGMAFLVGYLLAAVGPVAAGALRDATGGFTAVFGVLTGLGVVTLILGVAAGPPKQARSDPNNGS